MPHREPTIRSRELGEGLRQAMQQAGLSGKQAAQMLDVTPSYVSMLLAGKRAAREVDIAAFLGVCRVKGAERDRLLALCREQDTPGWFQQHGSRMPKQLVTLIDHENKADDDQRIRGDGRARTATDWRIRPRGDQSGGQRATR